MTVPSKQRASHEAGRTLAIAQREGRLREQKRAGQALDDMRQKLPKRPPGKGASR